MITKEQKKEIVKDLVDKLSRQKTAVFFDYTGLTVSQFHELREQLREQGLDCQAVKKTLISLALAKAGFKDIKARQLPGQIALVFGYQDEVLPAKILYDFSRNNEALKVLTGLVDGEYLENEAIIELAKLPSKQELLARLVNSIAAPIYGLNNALQGNLRKLVFILKGLKLET
ncbi:MAG: 50S ribosomal protein L10 [Parcubacteria group bacterium]|jgi:large subunit ribosomal protein L10|nr:50S ribosomal protein L10 [Parcubacteria group bacterium]|tara:strand:+ start:7253 stop:7771 length:519 start_codon:yes stop_codon:yes gene_type:complete